MDLARPALQRLAQKKSRPSLEKRSTAHMASEKALSSVPSGKGSASCAATCSAAYLR
jgi:hypothetical protein